MVERLVDVEEVTSSILVPPTKNNFMNNFDKLYREALKVSQRRRLSDDSSCGGVGAALLTRSGKTFTGICIDCPCGIGFCAEHSAVAEMLKSGESGICEIVAVLSDGNILPPCGRCRELITQVNSENKETLVHLSESKSKKLFELLPESYSDFSLNNKSKLCKN